MNEPIQEPIKEQKERIVTFYSNLKSEIGHVEIKFDFKESDFKKLSQEDEKEGDVRTSTFKIFCGIDKIKELLKELTGQETHIAEFSIYEEPSK